MRCPRRWERAFRKLLGVLHARKATIEVFSTSILFFCCNRRTREEVKVRRNTCCCCPYLSLAFPIRKPTKNKASGREGSGDSAAAVRAARREGGKEMRIAGTTHAWTSLRTPARPAPLFHHIFLLASSSSSFITETLSIVHIGDNIHLEPRPAVGQSFRSVCAKRPRGRCILPYPSPARPAWSEPAVIQHLPSLGPSSGVNLDLGARLLAIVVSTALAPHPRPPRTVSPMPSILCSGSIPRPQSNGADHRLSGTYRCPNCCPLDSDICKQLAFYGFCGPRFAAPGPMKAAERYPLRPRFIGISFSLCNLVSDQPSHTARSPHSCCRKAIAS